MTAGPAIDSPIVSTQWLADHLGASRLVVLDATVLVASGPFAGYVTGHERYILEGHVPGARFADLLESFSDSSGPFAFTRPGERQFSDAAGGLGIDNDTTVVVYDSEFGQWASRIWWLFRTFGYDRVAVLDGGLTKWLSEGRPTETGHVEAAPARFSAVPRPELWAEKSHVEEIVAGTADAALVCGLPPREFSGEVSPRARAGHIPGSLNVPASRLLDRESRTLLPEQQLREAFAPVIGRPIVAYCAGGIVAAADALALTVLGESRVAVYDGSLSEWATDPESALVTLV